MCVVAGSEAAGGDEAPARGAQKGGGQEEEGGGGAQAGGDQEEARRGAQREGKGGWRSVGSTEGKNLASAKKKG